MCHVSRPYSLHCYQHCPPPVPGVAKGCPQAESQLPMPSLLISPHPHDKVPPALPPPASSSVWAACFPQTPITSTPPPPHPSERRIRCSGHTFQSLFPWWSVVLGMFDSCSQNRMNSPRVTQTETREWADRQNDCSMSYSIRAAVTIHHRPWVYK